MPASTDDVTIPRQLFEFREYQAHMQRWLVQELKQTIDALVGQIEERDPDRAGKIRTIVERIMTEHDEKMVAAMQMTADEIRGLY